MSDSPADDTFDDHKLPDELEEGAQLAGNSDTGQSSPPFFPFSHLPCFMIDDETRRCVCSRLALFLSQASHLHLRNGVAVVPRAARTRRVLRAQPLPRPKLPQRLARRGKGVDLLKYALPNFFPNTRLISVIAQPKNVPEEGASGEPPAKRKRGRPPKHSKPSPPHEDVGEGGTSDSPTKRKRGRPPKNAA
jgi:hypothetical protein